MTQVHHQIQKKALKEVSPITQALSNMQVRAVAKEKRRTGSTATCYPWGRQSYNYKRHVSAMILPYLYLKAAAHSSLILPSVAQIVVPRKIQSCHIISNIRNPNISRN